MYYPYFRGKQYELITIRECAKIFADNNFIPIIEPVKEQLSGLKKSLDILCDAGAKSVVMINPQYGDHKTNGDEIIFLLNNHFKEKDNIIKGILLTKDIPVQDAQKIIESCDNSDNIALIHAGFLQAQELSEKISENENKIISIFLEDYCGKLYRKHFKTHKTRVLIRDGFQKRKNREHPEIEFFSDLHLTYEEENMNSFGDFLMVGDDYSETGGPAYTIAIHITFIDPDQDKAMYIHHFKSDRQDTPTDPAGKFAEALLKLMNELKQNNKIYITDAIKEFKMLYERKHFPGLGYVKKLSMKHHIETLANVLK